MLAIEIAWTVIGTVVGIGIGVGFSAVGMAPPEFKLARVCFWGSAFLLGGMDIVWYAQTGHSLLWRMVVSSLIGATIFVLLPEGLRWIAQREFGKGPESEPFKGKPVSPQDYPKLPGGPDLKRPMLMGQLLQSRWLNQVDANPSMLFLDISITNRGESSILKDWRLFLELGGKDVPCPIYPFPPQGLNLYEEGKQIARFTPDMSIAERGLHDPVEHGSVREGWIIFLVQKDDMAEVLKGNTKIRLEYHDYLENNYTLDFKLSKPSTPISPSYIPGTKNPEDKN